MENTQNKKPNKYAVLVTYLIAVVCLLLGLLLPFCGGTGSDGMLALQLPDVLNKVLNKDLLSFGKTFELSAPVPLFNTGKTLDVTAYAVLLYVVVTLFALIALIPIGISTKRGTRTASILAYIAEASAVIVTSLFMIADLAVRVTNPLFSSIQTISYSMLVALAGPLLMLIILSFMNKKAGGVAKFFLFLLSAVGVIALYNFPALIAKLSESSLLLGFYGEGGISVSGMDHISLLNSLGGVDAKGKALVLISTIITVIAILNYFTDVIGLASNGKKAGYCFNVARYGLQFLALVCILITVLVCKYQIGLMLIVLAAVVIIQLLISVIRLLMFLKRAKKTAKENVAFEDVELNEPALNYRKREPIDLEPAQPVNGEPYRQPPAPYAQPAPFRPQNEPFKKAPEPVYMEPEPVQEEVKPDENEPVQMDISDIAPETKETIKPVPLNGTTPVQANVGGHETRIYTINTIYGGPVDDFMRKLTNDEKVEFAMTFIEKSKGNIGNIPDYKIGGNNRLFFSSVFIYLGRVRGLISDNLLNKMYKELNIL